MFSYKVKVISSTPEPDQFRVVDYEAIASTSAEARWVTLEQHRQALPATDDKTVRCVIVEQSKSDDRSARSIAESFITAEQLATLERERNPYVVAS